MKKNLSHINQENRPCLVNIEDKQISYRIARAQTVIEVPASFKSQLTETSNGDHLAKKGPIFATAIVAGTQAVKRTSELIPFCHPLPIEKCEFEIRWNSENEILVECLVAANYKTGVEMEALTGASVAALTIYDMCKALSPHMVLKQTLLLEKRGGKHDFVRH